MHLRLPATIFGLPLAQTAGVTLDAQQKVQAAQPYAARYAAVTTSSA